MRLRIATVLGLLMLLGGCVSSQTGEDAALAERLEPVLNRLSRTGAVCSARVVELPSGRQLYAQDIDRPMIPASNQKLLVGAAMLDRFGVNYRWKTYLAFDGANLWVIGTGNPATGDGRIASWSGGSSLTMFDQWATALRGRGITQIPGDLYYYDGLLDDQRVHPSWEPADLSDWYAAPVGGLNFNDNCMDVSVRPAARHQRVLYQLTPALGYTRVVNECVSGGVGRPNASRSADGRVLHLTGTCAAATDLDSIPVTDPGFFFADALRSHLGNRGIRIDGQIRRAGAPLGKTLTPPSNMLIATHETPMQEVLWRMNKFSQNLFAEAMIKTLGRQHELDHGRNVRGSWAAGGSAIHAFLERHEIEDSQVVIEDGSGLSERNRLTTRAITKVLQAMFDHPAGELYRESLAMPGQSGTLARRMMDLRGQVMAKTGTLRGACNLSGYVRTRGGRWLSFSILYNGYAGDETPYHNLQDEACRVLAGYEP
ncbi:MAG TPA: D-alanyl-D-alanine carboxypeptidase/D-alanyl-D-alanine-endopeptidase [Tepidisphaeraceae bacterium]|nr:D-alanyl-D-alanine carboxypeptidase/D-alanyl-D-alanine-endopeptidase [Tepidisphaeraceae bacterium]